MPSFTTKFIFSTFLALLSLAFVIKAQTPPTAADEPAEKVFTEEIKLNILATDIDGKFFDGVKKEDLVINESGRLHQANSVKRIPANVLIVLDTGGEMRQAKSFDQTKATAKNLINSLQTEDAVAIMQYNDKVEIIAEWTNKDAALKLLSSKANFGRRSVFINALDAATNFLQKTPLDNRHLVLITDGTDSLNNPAERKAAMQNLLATDINVHVISYTQMETALIAPKAGKYKKGEPKPQRLPEEVVMTLPREQQAMLRMPRLGSMVTDKEFLRKMRERQDSLAESEKYLAELAKDTNGEIILPESNEEMLDKTALVAQFIDSSYVITYTPKHALADSEPGEVRDIEVTSRRPNLLVQAHRKLIVKSDR